MKTRITELFGIKYPIIGGRLGNLAYSSLASAISNAGALGQITAMTLAKPEMLRDEIRVTRRLTNKPFAVNFAIEGGRRPYHDHLQVAFEEGVSIISITGGNPEPLIQEAIKRNIKTIVLVASAHQALKAQEIGADAIIAVGSEGGGHIGRDDTSSIVLTPTVVDALDIPVIAAGGFGDARGFVAALALGADGIEMGTRFIATKECIAHSDYKQALINASVTDTAIIKRSLGIPGRALKSKATDLIQKMEKNGATFDELRPFINSDINKKAIYEGKYEENYSFVGQVIGLIDDVPSCNELIEHLISDSKIIINKLSVLSK